MNRLFVVALLLSTSAYGMNNDSRNNNYRYKNYDLTDQSCFSPIAPELPFRFEDQDICEIFHGKDLQDCGVNNEGSPSPSPEPETK